MTNRSIREVRARPLDIALTEPFGIAGGAQERAANVLVEVFLEDGSIGLGEAAPFPAVSGETQQSALAAARSVAKDLVGHQAGRTRALAELLEASIPDEPAARAAIEAATFDALGRSLGIPVSVLFGGAGGELHTDMTITTGDVEHARTSARAIRGRGIEALKIKVGQDPAVDVDRVRAAQSVYPDARILLDANGAFSAARAIDLVRRLASYGVDLALFEQPVAAGDIAGMAEVARESGVLVCADESARSPRDVLALIHARAAGAINIKLMKCGVIRAMEMALIARSADLELMIGGMVESPLAMSFSAHFASGLGGFAFADLDTFLFMKNVPFTGGITLEGGKIILPHTPGTGVLLGS